jgi:hypothetical protein
MSAASQTQTVMLGRFLAFGCIKMMLKLLWHWTSDVQTIVVVQLLQAMPRAVDLAKEVAAKGMGDAVNLHNMGRCVLQAADAHLGRVILHVAALAKALSGAGMECAAKVPM